MYLGKKSLEDHLILVVHITVYHIILVIQIILDIKAGRHVFCFHGFFQLFFCLHSNDVGILKGLFQNRHVSKYAGFINNADLCFILFVCFCFIGGIRLISGLCGSLFDAKHICHIKETRQKGGCKEQDHQKDGCNGKRFIF